MHELEIISNLLRIDPMLAVFMVYFIYDKRRNGKKNGAANGVTKVDMLEIMSPISEKLSQLIGLNQGAISGRRVNGSSNETQRRRESND